jgi:hypothetical protein
MIRLFIPLTVFLAVFAWGDIDKFGNIDIQIDPEISILTCPIDTPAGWRDDELLSLNDAKESITPRGVADALGKIHVVWKDNRRLNGRDEIHYRVRIDTIWSSLFAISNLDTAHNSPWIAVDKKNNVHVVFLRWFGASGALYDLGYRKYNDSLGMWEDEERITQSDSIGLAGRPKVLCDTSDVVYTFWLNENNTPRTIWFATNDGTGWSAKMPVTDLSDEPNGYYGVAVAPDNTIHCVFQDYQSGIPELFHRYYQNDTWSPSQPVTNNGFPSVYPRLAADTLSDMHLVYGGGQSLSEKIHYLIWDSANLTWGPETVFPSQMAVPHIDIAVSRLNSDVHLTFHESISGHIEIMYKYYNKQAGQWEPNVQLTFNYPDIRLDPQICLNPSDFVQLFWWDQRDGTGQEEIYYKTNRFNPGIWETHNNNGNEMMLSATPNPFSKKTGINFHIGQSVERIELKIYDVTGKLVKEFPLPATYPLLPTNISWSGADNQGLNCPPGVYLVKARSEDTERTIKIIKTE